MTTETTHHEKVAELTELVSQAEQRLLVATRAVDHATHKLDSELPTLLAKDDQTGVARMRKSAREAREAREAAKEEVASLQRALEAARNAAAFADQQADWDKAAGLSADVTESALEVKAAVQALVSAFDRFNVAREALRVALPWQPATVELASPMWSPQAAVQCLGIELYTESDGRLFPGRYSMSAWQLRQGPDFCARVRENITRAMSHRPSLKPEPPQAA